MNEYDEVGVLTFAPSLVIIVRFKEIGGPISRYPFLFLQVKIYCRSNLCSCELF